MYFTVNYNSFDVIYLEMINSKRELVSDLSKLAVEHAAQCSLAENYQVKPTMTIERLAQRTRSHPGVEICESILSDESNQRSITIERPYFYQNLIPSPFKQSLPPMILSSPLPKLNANAIEFKPFNQSATVAEMQKVLFPTIALTNPKIPCRRHHRGIRGRPIQLGIFR